MGMLPWLTYAGLPACYNWLYILACVAIITDASYEWHVAFSIAFAILGLVVFALICLMIFSVAMYYGYLSTTDVFREDENKMSLLITTI
ncbi:hypothetical protein R5R35_001693 [Gryllus longicercus]|uniref:Uncharacterized protein n=1 Tax=Gryllus longicercus TaxID=2509291 RepID=A0AAN9Z6D3_9ORTH